MFVLAMRKQPIQGYIKWKKIRVETQSDSCNHPRKVSFLTATFYSSTINPNKMKLAVVALALFAVVLAQEEDGDKYSTKYDKIDLDEILKSDRLFKNYYKCLLDEGPCSPDGNYLKKVLPDALETGCSKCSEKQDADSTKVIKYLSENRAEEWKVLKAKYDPDNKYVAKYNDKASREGIKL